MYDVAIIGCGISGASCAYMLSGYDLRIAVFEKSNDVGRYRILLKTLINLIFPRTSAVSQVSSSSSEKYTSENAEQLLEDLKKRELS